MTAASSGLEVAKSTAVIRTSISHPLQIAEVRASGGGAIGVTFCPGKHQRYAATGAWERDLSLDLTAIRDWGAGVLITLVTPAELRELKVENLGETARSLGLTWLHLPISDVSTPTPKWEHEWRGERDAIHQELDRGGRVVVHCKGGLGRAGTVAALILVERGVDAVLAIRQVRAARDGVIETSAQATYVASPRATWSAPKEAVASTRTVAQAAPLPDESWRRPKIGFHGLRAFAKPDGRRRGLNCRWTAPP